MQIEKITLRESQCFSGLFLDYIEGKEALKPYYGHPPEIGSFEKQIAKKSFSEDQRAILYKSVHDQYGAIDKSQALYNNIESLKESNTFTITTGHQLNIFTGPLYVIYKLVSIINACKQLKEAYPKHHFVPVYWMASEDHDFEEIRHFRLFGQKYQWETDQKGAVGRFSPYSLSHLLNEVPETIGVFEKAYLDFPTLAEAVRVYMNKLFGAYGLIVLDADNKNLKTSFTEIIQDDLTFNKANELVEECSSQLGQLGYKTPVTPREINFFYLENGTRERIVKKDQHYQVLNTDLTFTQEEILTLAADQPELFSPNVVMRPLYQEKILPNLAYVGGPSEIAYWLQLKSLFAHYRLPLPILMPRNFALIINKANQRKIDKLSLSTKSLFFSLPALKQWFLIQKGNGNLDLEEESKKIQNLYGQIKEKAIAVDSSLDGYMGAEENKALKAIQAIEKRIKKAKEQKEAIAMNQIESIKEKLFPNGQPQERVDNFLNFYHNQEDFIGTLIQHFDPFEYSYYRFSEA